MPLDLLTCPPLLSHEEAAAALNVTVPEVGKLLASGHLTGNCVLIRASSVRNYIDHEQRKLIEPPPKHVTQIVWPGPTS